jgi:hypothetical protein
MAKFIIVINECKECDMAHNGICYELHTFNKPTPANGIPSWCTRPGLTEVEMESNPWDETERRSNDDQANV